MSESLLRYYEEELAFLRQLGQDFGRRYPEVAGRLFLEEGRSLDPHVERLLQGVALLTGRVRAKLDDEFPELTDALLTILYPHYLAPIPSMAVVQFDLDIGRVDLPNGFLIDRYSEMYTQPIHELACEYRTCYPVTLWPVRLKDARLIPPPYPSGLEPPDRTVVALRLELECPGEARFSALSLDRLRFYLWGDNQVIARLYEYLFNWPAEQARAPAVVFRSLDKEGPRTPVILTPEECLFQVGFETTEGMVPYPRQSFLGYRLLTEFFSFPSKFLFLDLGGFRKVSAAGFGHKLEVFIFLNRSHRSLEQAVNTSTFRLGCTPVINLFAKDAEPITLTQTRSAYRIVPDVGHPRGMEVYSINEVISSDPARGTVTTYQPFYSFRHGRSTDKQRTFWYSSRRPAFQKGERGEDDRREGDRGTEVFLHLVDLDFDPSVPSVANLQVKTTCTNRELPVILQKAGEDLAFYLKPAAPLERIRCVRTPTSPLRPRARRGAHWRLLSHLSLNHLSISDPVEGRETLQEILRLYDFSDPVAGQQLAAVTEQMIEGITFVSSRRIVGRTGVEISSGFCRGLEVTIEFDEEKYVGSGSFLFACVLERFLGLYASLNSFSQLVARTKQAEGILKKWPPRAGEQRLL
jgi:type VI secretion system protein ImpG